MSGKTILVWFRNDLRINDNEVLTEAVNKADTVLPVYCYDPFYYRTTSFGTQKTGNFRARFINESVAGLREALQQLGGNLIVRTGDPAIIIPELAQQYQVSEVYHHREVAFEETNISSKVEAALWKLKLNLKHFIGHTLHNKEDLPFPVKDIPDAFTTFRKKVERDSQVRRCAIAPKKITTPEITDAGEIPTLAELGLTEPFDDERAVMRFTGGEAEGLKRLHGFIWEKNLLKTYKASHNLVLGSDSSTKMSPWLSMGCVSPRQIFWEVQQYEKAHGSNDSTHALILELLWRDYYRFMFKKYGNQFFQKAGFKGQAPLEAANQDELLEKWKTGQTGVPFIDAIMREMNATGYASNRGRQNAASFLVKDLQVDWTRGAAYFEEKLIDYSPASTWGNWASIAGVGNDAKESRLLNVIKQAGEADPKGQFVKLWVPELSAIPGKQIHTPFFLTQEELAVYGIQLGKDYPAPIIQPKWQKLSDKNASIF
ncbi:DASH family cryptochrome [Mucilaginibacter sp. HMF7410]|uniref:Cryptochrome DASH n=2 Tax=Mucilaginibacter arboris TaxID=2682090 RepID=A0A7K1SWU8_9SPHI|nr:DASH family cryptochrome [Mucilaginibacter arboris]